MTHRSTKIVILLTAALAFGCSKERTAIEGKWEIDLEPMIQQAKSLGAAARDVQEIRDTFIDGKLVIDSSRMTLTIGGMRGSEVKEYKVLSKDGQCVKLSFKANSGEHRYCAVGSRLEAHDPSTKLVVVYRKA